MVSIQKGRFFKTDRKNKRLIILLDLKFDYLQKLSLPFFCIFSNTEVKRDRILRYSSKKGTRCAKSKHLIETVLKMGRSSALRVFAL